MSKTINVTVMTCQNCVGQACRAWEPLPGARSAEG